MDAPAGKSQLLQLKAYLRVSGDEDDALLLDLREAAVEYLATCGVVRPARGAARYDLAVQGLVLGYYDQMRAGGSDEGAETQPLALRQLINQLKLSAE